MLFFFFFFQAEDGIRDRNVTGVQTCALPIYLLLHGRRELDAGLLEKLDLHHLGIQLTRADMEARLVPLALEQMARDCRRSEERRVGKECRSRRSPYREKKREKEHHR